MKLLNISFTKPRYWVLGLAAVAGAGTAQAQFTGIGTTNPQAALHVATDTTDAADYEPLRVDYLRGLETGVAAEEAKYSDVVLYDAGTGLFRRESISDLLDSNGEFVYNDDVTGAETLIPRRATVADEFTITNAVGIGIANNLTVGGNAAVTGNATVTADLTVDGNTALATGAGDVVTLANLTRVPTAPATTVPGTSQILLRNTTTNVVEYAQLDDLLADNGMWVENATNDELLPRVTTYANTIGITATTVDVKKNLNVVEATTLDSTLNVVGRVFLEDVDRRAPAASAVADDDRILIQQDGADLVEYVSVEDLLQDNGEWRFQDVASDAPATPKRIYAYRAQNDGGNDVVITETQGYVGIGTAAPTEALQIVGGNIQLDQASSVLFGAGNSLTSAASGVTLTSTATINATAGGAINTTSAAGGITTTATTGDIVTAATAGSIAISAPTAGSTVTIGANGPSAILNDNGLSIGIATGAIANRVLQTDAADGIQFGSLTAVTNVTTSIAGTDDAGFNPDDFRNVVLTDNAGVLRVIDIDNLISESGEWVYEDLGVTGFTNDDKIYVRRIRENGVANSEVFVDGVGNMVLDASKAFQFGDATNQVTASELNASGAYTMDLESSLTVETGDGADVSFVEGANAPWLHFAAGNGGTGTGAYLGRVGIGTNTPAASLHVVGNIVASHTAQTSDRRFKRDINELQGALDAIEAMRGVSYDFRTDEFPQENFDDATHIGFIAQELQEVLPQAVFERNDGFLTVDYAAVTPVLVEAVQELSDRIETLEAENAALRQGNTDQAVGAVSTKQFQELEARLAAMDARLEAATTGRK